MELTVISLLILNATIVVCFIIDTQRKIKILVKHYNDDSKSYNDLNLKMRLSILAAFLLTAFAFAAPYFIVELNNHFKFAFQDTGYIGDTIGGLMNPFIALSGVIVTGLAFYIQVKANQQQRDFFITEQSNNKTQLDNQIKDQKRQSDLQQFESRFYESLKLHRENIVEMRITGYDFREQVNPPLLVKFEKVTEGRKVFVTMTREFECLLGIYKNAFGKMDRDGFKKCYQIFFSGLDNFAKNHPEDAFIETAYKARWRHESPLLNGVYYNEPRKEFSSNAHLYFNYKPFSGHDSRLGHYFRHLFLSVKSVVNSEIEGINYEEKMNYLRLLRSQLSNHEQILLFYNWLSTWGIEWENSDNQFFTEYKMIHNLWYNQLFDDDFIKQAISELRDKEVKLRFGEMFEIDK